MGAKGLPCASKAAASALSRNDRASLVAVACARSVGAADAVTSGVGVVLVALGVGLSAGVVMAVGEATLVGVARGAGVSMGLVAGISVALGGIGIIVGSDVAVACGMCVGMAVAVARGTTLCQTGSNASPKTASVGERNRLSTNAAAPTANNTSALRNLPIAASCSCFLTR